MNSPTYQSGGFLTILAAVIPAVFLLYKVYQYDRTEKEPTSLIVSLVMLGVLSTFCAIATEQFGIGLLSNIFAQDSILFRFFMFFFVVGLSEEGFKYLFLKRRTWNDPHFDTTYDGIVYAVAVSLGFALFENIMYVGRFGLEVAAVRAVTAIPGHACFSVFMGVWYAEAKKQEKIGDLEGCQKCLKQALIVPIILHGAYDFVASMSASGATIVFFLFIFYIFRRAYVLVRASAQNDTHL